MTEKISLGRATNAIYQSATYRKIVECDWSEDMERALMYECVGFEAETKSRIVFHGKDEDGDTWSVRLVGRRVVEC
jgi:hypothetical protein